MADESFPSPAAENEQNRDERPRGGRSPGGRDSGGFRIRLSDNEMQAARTLQEAFGLRSTVAVLGFSLRAMAQLLEQGQLDALIAQQRAEGGSRGGGERPERRGERREGRHEGSRDGARSGRGGRVDPFARPSRPAAAAPPEEPAAEAEAELEPAAEFPADTAAPAASEVVSGEES
jgi:hypothetical protein